MRSLFCYSEYVYKKLDPILDELKLENPYSDVHDVAVIQRNNWMMYGSKKPHGEPYKLTKIYQMDTDPDNIFRILHFKHEVPVHVGNGAVDDPVLLIVLNDIRSDDGDFIALVNDSSPDDLPLLRESLDHNTQCQKQ